MTLPYSKFQRHIEEFSFLSKNTGCLSILLPKNALLHDILAIIHELLIYTRYCSHIALGIGVLAECLDISQAGLQHDNLRLVLHMPVVVGGSWLGCLLKTRSFVSYML